MKKNVFFRVMAAFAVTAVLFLASCDNGSTDDDNSVDVPKTLSGNITISPSTGVTTGTEMTATYSGSETVTYQWKKGGNTITGAVQTTYTPPEAGSYTVTVSAADYNPKTSAAVTVTGETLPALTGTLTISGNTVVGRTLTATTSALSGTGTFAYQWKRGDTAAAVTTDIPGANGQTYTLTGADKGRYIAVSVTRSGNSGSVTSAATGPVTDPPSETIVSGADLAAKLKWLKDYAQNDRAYLITIDKNETLAGITDTNNNSINYLYYTTSTGRGNITIRLTGDRAINLSSSGSLFIIENGVTLILDKIALYGVVKVNSGGALEMGTGARITSNTTYSGGVSVSGGTFTMNGGEISGNNGSGVSVSSGTFTMNGGEISGNSTGVSVSGGTFIMSGGEISGNSGNGVYVSNWNSSVGTFTKTGGTITGSDAQNGNGYAVYAGVGKRRETTAGPGVALDSTKFGTAGGWDNFAFTPLTANTWADGNLPTLDDVQWFKFTATASTQYIHANLTSTGYLYVQVYNLNGVAVGYEWSLDSDFNFNNPRSQSVTVTLGQEYYIYIRRNYYWDNGCTYQITFNNSSTPPLPSNSATATTLTANTWTDGNIPTSNGEQWFKFTATASTQYIHASFGTLDRLYVQVYNSSGDTVGSQTLFSEESYYDSGNKYTSRSVTVGQEYYVRVRPYNIGTYSIAFNATVTIEPRYGLTLDRELNTGSDWDYRDGGANKGNISASTAAEIKALPYGSVLRVYITGKIYDPDGSTEPKPDWGVGTIGGQNIKVPSDVVGHATGTSYSGYVDISTKNIDLEYSTNFIYVNIYLGFVIDKIEIWKTN
jgi:hypothetical protein